MIDAAAILKALDLTPKVVDVGKDIWKKLKPPEQMARPAAKNGISDNTYYSEDYKFQVSIPDNNWAFWKPTPQFIASQGMLFTLPTRDIPILILSKNVVKLYRPYIIIVVEDVGSYTNIDEITNYLSSTITAAGSSIIENGINISSKTNSSVLISTGNLSEKRKIYQVTQIYLHASKAIQLAAFYIPVSDDSPGLFGGLQDIMNSFKLIK